MGEYAGAERGVAEGLRGRGLGRIVQFLHLLMGWVSSPQIILISLFLWFSAPKPILRITLPAGDNRLLCPSQIYSPLHTKPNKLYLV